MRLRRRPSPRRSWSALSWRWALRDVPAPYTFTFQPKDRTRVLDALKSRLKPKEQSRLISNLERAVALYKGWDEFERRQLPESEVKRKAKELYLQVHKLQKILGDLDLGTRRALAPFLASSRIPSAPLLSAEKPRELVRFERQLDLLDRRLAALAEVTGAYFFLKSPPRRGPKVRSAQEALAVAVADALAACEPAIKIVSTVGGTYEDIVRICFKAAGLRATGDLHRVVLLAVKAYRSPYRARGGKFPAP